ncbi:MAG TPA: acyltransferase family protein [Candidatus Saccharimonadales bacterium]|nr:acyltransferase family protein [Candidatus Saccharimonadales bacterium]
MPKKQEGTNSVRQYDLDFLRVIAIAAVVLIHCIAAVQFKPVDSAAWMTTNLLDSFIHWCVPVFVMISGALLINERAYKNTGEFFKKRFSRIAIPLLIWPVVYYLAQVLLFSAPFKPRQFITSFFAGNPLFGNHLYFLFLIAGLYAITPLLSAYISRVPRKHIWVAAIVICLAATTWDALIDMKLMKLSLNMFTQGLPFVGYFLLGYLLKDTVLKPKQAKITAAIFIGTSLLIAATAYYLTSQFDVHKGVRAYSYTYIFIIISSVAAFLLGRYVYNWNVRRLSKKALARLHTILRDLSAKSFGVYLVHFLIFNSLLHAWHLDRYSLKEMLFIFPVVVITSWIAVSLLRYMPKARYLLG